MISTSIIIVDRALSIYPLFLDIIRTVDVVCRTKGPKFLDPWRRILGFRTVLHRTEHTGERKNAAFFVRFSDIFVLWMRRFKKYRELLRESTSFQLEFLSLILLL
jgi:hypothetical protein